MSKRKTIRVAELFAGVGGFRIGLEAANKSLKEAGPEFRIVWSNQWEPPGKGPQHASRVYVNQFGAAGHVTEDISKIEPDSPEWSVPDFDLLVGGFPCQDYSVAKPLNQSSGLKGKKGVLWWEIHRFMEARLPKMALLENVDRLLVSPGGQRGRDFAVMLASLNNLGYAVEWRVINAADYGYPQRRKRVFIIAHLAETRGAELISSDSRAALLSTGVLARAFRVEPIPLSEDSFRLSKNLWEVSESFNKLGKESQFLSGGACVDHMVVTAKLTPKSRKKKKTLAHIIEKNDKKIPPEFFLTRQEVQAWQFLKGAKRLSRTKKNGISYEYAEGAMSFPDPLDRPARTIITSEGGRTPSRFKHVIRTPKGRLRRLTPIELEKLSGFPRNHTKLEGVTDARRAFFIGNALVTGLVADIGRVIRKHRFL